MKRYCWVNLSPNFICLFVESFRRISKIPEKFPFRRLLVVKENIYSISVLTVSFRSKSIHSVHGKKWSWSKCRAANHAGLWCAHNPTPCFKGPKNCRIWHTAFPCLLPQPLRDLRISIYRPPRIYFCFKPRQACRWPSAFLWVMSVPFRAALQIITQFNLDK